MAVLLNCCPTIAFWCFPVLKGEYPIEAPGQSGSELIDGLNAALEQRYPSHFVRVGQSITPMDRTGDIHLNDHGYGLIAAEVQANLLAKGW